MVTTKQAETRPVATGQPSLLDAAKCALADLGGDRTHPAWRTIEELRTAIAREEPHIFPVEKRSGFSLLELLVVIAILVLLVAVTMPAIKYSLDESKVRESSRQLNSYLAMAKSRAASTGRPCGIWLESTIVGPNTTPPAFPGDTQPPDLFQCTQLYLCEVPALYSGDILESRALADQNLLLHFAPPASAASLSTLVPDGDTFTVKFDHKGVQWYGYRSGTDFYLTGQTYPPPGPNEPPPQPPRANPDGYAYTITRNPVRIGSPLALPRGTAIDLSYSGFGSDGSQCYAERQPGLAVPTTNASQPALLVLFSPSGHLGGVSYRTWNKTSSRYERTATAPPQHTLHLLVGKQIQVANQRFVAASNIHDSGSLWVSVARLTGSVTTADNGADVTLANYTPEQYLERAREFARSQDVKH